MKNKKRKLSRKQITAIVIVAVLAVIFVISRVAARRAAFDSQRLASGVTEGTVTRGNITKTVTGTGSLTAQDDNEVEVPVGVHVEKVMVEPGDSVKKGDTIATVTSLSVQEQLLQIQNSIDSLQSEIDGLDSSDKNYELTKEVKSAEKDKLVQDRSDMQALLRTCRLTSTADGTVDQIALEDDEDIAKGALSASSGSSDASSSVSSSAASLSSLLAGTSSAPSGSTGEAAEEVQAAQAENSGAEENLQAAGGSTGGSASSGTESTAAQPSQVQASQAADTQQGTTQDAGQQDVSDKLISRVVGYYIIPPVTGMDPMTDEQLNSSIIRSAAHYSASVKWDPADKPFKEKTAYTATVTLTADDGYSFPSSTENVTGEYHLGLVAVSLDGKGTVKKLVITQKFDETMVSTSTLQKQLSDIAQKAIQDTVANASTIIASSIKEMMQQVTSGGSSLNLSNIAGLSGKNLSDYAGISGLSGLSGANGLSGLSGADSLSGLSGVDASSLTSGSDALSSLSGVDAQGSSSYNAYKTVGMTVTPDTKAMIDIDVDEMDINSLTNGQAATVTIDALEGDTFHARITKIANSTSGSDGAAKFKVRLEMDKTKEMKYGMSASASIQVSSKNDVLLIPMDALQTVDGKSVVYTSVDSSGNPSDSKEVKTGVSDGENVEITSGLSEGETIYYTSSGTYDAVESIQNERDSMRENAQDNSDSSDGQGGQDQEESQ